MKKYKHTKEKKMTERVSFYIALSICIMAVGMAGWSAYMTFAPSENENDGYFSSLKNEEAVAQEMTGVPAKNDQKATSPAKVTEPTLPAQTEPAPTETRPARSFYLGETLPDQSEKAVIGGELSPLQAVLRVSESLSYPLKSHSVLKTYSEDSVYNNTMHDYRAHTGCDFAAETGETVFAMCGGTVKDISVSELYGVIVEVNSGDFTVYYCGLDSKFSVSEGDTLSTGDTVGTVSQIPCESADKPHVHIEIRVGDQLIDPLSVIDSEN